MQSGVEPPHSGRLTPLLRRPSVSDGLDRTGACPRSPVPSRGGLSACATAFRSAVAWDRFGLPRRAAEQAAHPVKRLHATPRAIALDTAARGSYTPH
jgi:hypothetical protein